MKKNIFDIIVIGAGSGGLNVSGFFSRLSLKILVIDKAEINIGGDCLNTGCVPSKALIHVANKIFESNDSSRFMVSNIKNEVDIQKVINYVHSKQEIIRKNENSEYLKNKGITFISGDAKFINKNSIELNGEIYSAKNFVLATGSRPKELKIRNDNSIKQYTNENIFNISYLPKNFVFLGGGPISCELGQAFSRLGSKVTIINRGERLLEKETEEVSEKIQDVFEKENITVINNSTVEKIENKKVYYKKINSNEEIPIEADTILMALGRELNIENLELEKAGIKKNIDNTKLLVNEYLQTTNKNIYVVGDVAGNYQFTHASEMHAKVVINNLLSPFKKKFDSQHIAWVTYTSPAVATFGIQKRDAISYKILSNDFKNDDRAIIDENRNGLIEVYFDEEGCIKGGTMVCENAGEIAQELVLAMSAKIPISKIFEKVYPYPTASRINKSIANKWMERKLTKGRILLLKLLYKIN